MSYWEILGLILFLWAIVYFSTKGKLRVNVWIGILIYGVVRAAFYWLSKVVRVARYVFTSDRQRQPTRPKVAKRVSDIVSVHKLKPFEVVLGFSGPRPIKVDFKKHHTLIGSTTGGGKTNLLNAILIQLFGKGKRFSEDSEVYLIDLKGDENDCLAMWRPLLAGYAEFDENEIDNAIRLLLLILDRMENGSENKHIILVIDEVAMLTSQSSDRGQMKTATRILTRVLSQLRSRGTVIMAVQHPRYDVVPTPIRSNADRKIMLPVDGRDHARVVLGGMRPNDSELPERPGEFLLKEPGRRGLTRGQAMLVELPSEIDQTVFANIEDHLSDQRLKLFHDIVAGKVTGAPIDGVVKVAKTRKDFTQGGVQTAYRNYALAGALSAPERRGQSYVLAVDYHQALSLLKEYISKGNWMQQPDPFVNDN